MGGAPSKSSLERRNTNRKTQRKMLHNIETKVDKVYIDINSFEGVEKDDNYALLCSKIRRLKDELVVKLKGQLEDESAYEIILVKISAAFGALEGKLKENQMNVETGETQICGNNKDDQEEIKEQANRDTENFEQATSKLRPQGHSIVQEMPHEQVDVGTVQHENENQEKVNKREDEKNQVANPESELWLREIEKTEMDVENLGQAENRTETEGFSDVQIRPRKPTNVDSFQLERKSEVLKGPIEKVKIISKVINPVMPAPKVINISAPSVPSTYELEFSSQTDDKLIIAEIDEITQHLGELESQIAKFVKKKEGNRYNRISNHLNNYTEVLDQFHTSNSDTVKRIQICRNDIEHCRDALNNMVEIELKQEMGRIPDHLPWG